MTKKDWSCNSCHQDQEQTYPDIFDTIIIGAGPGGMTAAIYAARRKMTTLLICGQVGGQLNYCSDIENWTGVQKATGQELFDQFFSHVKKVDNDNAHFDLWVREREKVISVKQKNGIITNKHLFVLQTNTGKTFKTRTVICCAGKVSRMLGVPGESVALNGNGLSFSATSDAPLYKDKKMVVVGGGNSAMDVTLQLTKFTKDITLLTDIDHLIGEGILQDKIKKHPGTKVEYNVKVKEILLNDQQKVCGVRYVQSDEEKIIDCEGIFEEVGFIPATDFLKDTIDLNGQGEIVTNRRCETSAKGFFAAGDCTDQAHKQTIVAAGEGAIAALEAHEYVLRAH